MNRSAISHTGEHYGDIPRARLECGHLKDWPEVAPRPEDIVWCHRCDGYRMVKYIYLVKKGRARAMQCRQRVMRVRDRQVIELCCTSDREHSGDHYDESLAEGWARTESGIARHV